MYPAQFSYVLDRRPLPIGYTDIYACATIHGLWNFTALWPLAHGPMALRLWPYGLTRIRNSPRAGSVSQSAGLWRMAGPMA